MCSSDLVKTAIEEDVPAVPVKTPRERALGRIEHFKAVVEGKEDSFYVYFVLGLEEHEDMHRHFLEELGLPYPTVKDLSDMHEPHAVLTDGDVQLIRSSNVYEDGEAYDITYKSAPFENSY